MCTMAENGMSRRDFIKLATIGLASVLAAARLKNAYLDANRELVGIMWERFPDIVEDEWKVDLFLDVSKPILLERAAAVERGWLFGGWSKTIDLDRFWIDGVGWQHVQHSGP